MSAVVKARNADFDIRTLERWSVEFESPFAGVFVMAFMP
jgi:hypothetical protein